MADANPTERKGLEAALAPTDACVTIEQLSRLCDADRAGGADARAAEHVAGCLRCRTELALLKAFESASPGPGEEAAASWIVARLERDVARMTGAPQARSRVPGAGQDQPRWRRLLAFRPVAGALAIAAAMLLVVLNVPWREAGPPALSPDVAGGPAVFRSDSVAVVGPVGDLDEPPAELRWEAAPGAVSYSVQMMEVDRTEVWNAQSRQASVSLPAAVRARMVPGKPLLWQVVAKDGAGKTVAASEVQRFRVRVRQPHPGE